MSADDDRRGAEEDRQDRRSGYVGLVRRVSMWRPLLWVVAAIVIVVAAERLGLFGG